MPEYKLIDAESWVRYDHFRHFTDEAPCTIWLTDDIDVTEVYEACHRSGRSFYITVLYAVAKVINSHDEFKMHAVDSPEFPYLMPAVWDRVDPVHNVFHEDSETYTSTFTLYHEDYSTFYSYAEADIERARRLKVMSVPAGDNTFEASALPWRHFTSVGAVSEGIPLSPIVAWGKFIDRCGMRQLPLSIQISHAAADGYHLARFLNEVEATLSSLANEI